MSRIFCVEFPAVDNRHTALVSMYTKNKQPVYHIQFTDAHLKNLFLAEHLRYEGEEGYRLLEFYKDPFTRLLLQKMASAIGKVVCGQPAMVRWLVPSS